MLFNSFIFLTLLILTFIVYYIPAFSRVQILILLVSSLIFYAYDQPELVFLLLGSALLNTLSSYYITKTDGIKQKIIVTTGVIVNLLLLGFFKYNSLLQSAISSVKSIDSAVLNIPLPIGISFFTFEGITLLVDVYRGDIVERNKIVPKSFLDHCTRTLFFISFFPHLVAGPILKAHDFLPQIKTKYSQLINWQLVFQNLLIGYFLKMVVADNLKDFTFFIDYPYFLAFSTANLLFMLVGYSCQIFADFAGYSLIAMGLANLFGYSFHANFNFPYISTSFKEFWKRWHISLSSFLMEYLYFPLGGNRKGELRTYLNILITMFLGGLWHGAAWSYAVWGSFHGVALVIERFFTNRVKLQETTLLSVLKGIFVFTVITIAWLLFKLPDFNHVLIYIQSIYMNTGASINLVQILAILLYSTPVILYHLIYLFKIQNRLAIFNEYKYVYYALMIFFILLNSGTPGSFIYFQF